MSRRLLSLKRLATVGISLGAWESRSLVRDDIVDQRGREGSAIQVNCLNWRTCVYLTPIPHP